MAPRPSIIRQRDVTRIMKGAQEAGITLGIVVTAAEVRFVPVDATAPSQTLTDFDRWKAKRDAQKTKAQARGGA